jgi:hypothetical protein
MCRGVARGGSWRGRRRRGAKVDVPGFLRTVSRVWHLALGHLQGPGGAGQPKQSDCGAFFRLMVGVSDDDSARPWALSSLPFLGKQPLDNQPVASRDTIPTCFGHPLARRISQLGMAAKTKVTGVTVTNGHVRDKGWMPPVHPSPCLNCSSQLPINMFKRPFPRRDSQFHVLPVHVATQPRIGSVKSGWGGKRWHRPRWAK